MKKKMIIEKNDEIMILFDNLVAVRSHTGNKWMIIDTTGNLICDEAEDCHQFMFKVGLDGKYGVMNKIEGAFTGCKYDKATCHYAIDYRMADIWLNNKQGFVDARCKRIVPIKYDFIDPFENGLARVTIDNKYGFVDKNGKEVIPLLYDDAQTDYEGDLLWVQIHGKYGFINTAGGEVIPLHFDEAKPFSEEMAAVKVGKKWGYINKAGVEVIPPSYTNVMRFVNGKALVCKGKKVVQIDKKGKIIRRLYNFVRFVYGETYLLVEHEGKQGIINNEGNTIVVPQYDKIINPGFWKYYTIALEGKYGVVDDKGNEIVPPIYDAVESQVFVDNDLVLVTLNGKQLFINKEGNESINTRNSCICGSPVMLPCRSEEIQTFDAAGFAGIKIDGKWGIVNRKGLLIVACDYDEVDTGVFSARKGNSRHRFYPNGQEMNEWNLLVEQMIEDENKMIEAESLCADTEVSEEEAAEVINWLIKNGL
jgi:hypothetical protein